jgi:cbb3-type cytochrome oxidase subunit 3
MQPLDILFLGILVWAFWPVRKRKTKTEVKPFDSYEDYLRRKN